MKTLTTLFFIMCNISIYASSVSIVCETPRKNITIKLSDNKLKIGGRFPAEAIAQRTRLRGNSISKIFFVAGDKHTLHLEDTTSFNSLNDYISIRNKKGHEMTYPVDCSEIK